MVAPGLLVCSVRGQSSPGGVVVTCWTAHKADRNWAAGAQTQFLVGGGGVWMAPEVGWPFSGCHPRWVLLRNTVAIW